MYTTPVNIDFCENPFASLIFLNIGVFIYSDHTEVYYLSKKPNNLLFSSKNKQFLSDINEYKPVGEYLKNAWRSSNVYWLFMHLGITVEKYNEIIIGVRKLKKHVKWLKLNGFQKHQYDWRKITDGIVIKCSISSLNETCFPSGEILFISSIGDDSYGYGYGSSPKEAVSNFLEKEEKRISQSIEYMNRNLDCIKLLTKEINQK